MNAFLRNHWVTLVAAAVAIGGYIVTLQTVVTEVASVKQETAAHTQQIADLKVEQARLTEATSDLKQIRATSEETARNVAALCQATGANCR